MPVRSHRNTNPGAADQDTARYSTFSHDSGKSISKIRVVNRIWAIRSKIKHRQTPIPHHGNEGRLKFVPRVIRRDADGV